MKKFILTLSIFVSACVSGKNDNYNLTLNQWLNQSEYKLVFDWGEPDNIINIAGENKNWSMVFHGDDKSLKRLKKELKIHIIKRPFIDNPFIIDSSLVEFFENLLFEETQ